MSTSSIGLNLSNFSQKENPDIKNDSSKNTRTVICKNAIPTDPRLNSSIAGDSNTPASFLLEYRPVSLPEIEVITNENASDSDSAMLISSKPSLPAVSTKNQLELPYEVTFYPAFPPGIGPFAHQTRIELASNFSKIHLPTSSQKTKVSALSVVQASVDALNAEVDRSYALLSPQDVSEINKPFSLDVKTVYDNTF